MNSIKTFNITEFKQQAEVMLQEAKEILRLVSDLDEEGWTGMSEVYVQDNYVKWELWDKQLHLYYTEPYDGYVTSWEVPYELFGMSQGRLTAWALNEIEAKKLEYKKTREWHKEELKRQLALLEDEGL